MKINPTNPQFISLASNIIPDQPDRLYVRVRPVRARYQASIAFDFPSHRPFADQGEVFIKQL
jgi:hypothetical protein